ISSSPLLASVAESIVIFGPIRQVGWASASSGVTSASSSRVRPRNGPPEPVSTSECTCSGLRPSRHWYSAECSLSTGMIRPRPATSSPPATRLSLFASASVTPFTIAHSVAWMPAKPTTAFSTTSGRARSSSSVRSPPTCFSGASTSSSGVEPDATAHSSSSGCASTISIAWRPIEPVAPRRATRLMLGPVYGRSRRAHALRSGRDNRAMDRAPSSSIEPATLDRLLGLSEGAPDAQLRAADALDSKIVQVFSAGTVLIGLPALRGVPQHRVTVAFFALAVAAFLVLAFYAIRALSTPDQLWNRFWDEPPEAIKHAVMADLASGYAENDFRLHEKRRELSRVLVSVGVEAVAIGVALTISAACALL